MKINSIQLYTNNNKIVRDRNKSSKDIQNPNFSECKRNESISFTGLFPLKKATYNAQILNTDVQMIPNQEYVINEDTVFESCGYRIDLGSKELKGIIKHLQNDESFTIGRNEYRLPDMPTEISRRHLEIRRNQRGELTAKDLNSTNGTKIKQNIRTLFPENTQQELIPGQYYLLPYNSVVCAHETPIFISNYKNALNSLPNGKELIIGRNDSCDIKLDNNYISGRHLALRPYMGSVLVKDLHSTNGSSFQCYETENMRRPSPYVNDLFYITDSAELQKNVPTRIPNDCQIYLGRHFTIDVRNPNILEVLNQKGKIKIGRNSNCDLVVDKFYSHVSREHLQLEKVGDNIIATDLNSSMDTQIIPKNKIRAFNGGVENLELGQQNIGDCYLLSTIYALSMTKQGQKYLENMVSVDDKGNYIVDFYSGYSPISVRPEELDGQKYKGTEKRNVSGDLGIRAIERAYGKLVKSFGSENRTLYMAIDDGGWPNVALRKMTGIESDVEAIKDGKIQKKLQELCAMGLENFVLTCSTPKKGNFFGYMDYQRRFNENHAYGIKNIDSYKQTIEIVNPHNTMKSETISWNEFAQLFDYIYIGNFNKRFLF